MARPDLPERVALMLRWAQTSGRARDDYLFSLIPELQLTAQTRHMVAAVPAPTPPAPGSLAAPREPIPMTERHFTDEAIARIANVPIGNVQEHWPRVCRALDRVGINRRPVALAAIATIAIETASQFRPVVEAFWLSDAQRHAEYIRRYSHRTDLGFTGPADAVRFYGQGLIQLTGPTNYERYGRHPLIQRPLRDKPEEALHPDVSAMVLAVYFNEHGAPQTSVAKQADAGDWPETRRLVQGGHAGLDRYLAIIRGLEREGAQPKPSRFHFPVTGYRGQVNLHWGQAIGIGGSDIFGGRGARIVAVERSRVAWAGWSGIGGWNVGLKGLETGLDYYMAHGDPHNPNARGVFVSAGQVVPAGHHLMNLGDSGNAQGTGPHLHIGIGHGINEGGGPLGGLGINFNAVDFLRRILAGVDEGDGDDMAEVVRLRGLLERERMIRHHLTSEEPNQVVWALEQIRGTKIVPERPKAPGSKATKEQLAAYAAALEAHAATVEQLVHDWYRESDHVKQELLRHSLEHMPIA